MSLSVTTRINRQANQARRLKPLVTPRSTKPRHTALDLAKTCRTIPCPASQKFQIVKSFSNSSIATKSFSSSA